MKTRAPRPALIAAALTGAAAVVLFAQLRPGPMDVEPGSVTRVTGSSSGHATEPVQRPGPAPPIGSSAVDDRALEPVSMQPIDESPERYATGASEPPDGIPVEAQLEAPTSPGPGLPYDQGPAVSPYESPTGSRLEAGTQQAPVSESNDLAPTSMPYESPAMTPIDPEPGNQDPSPTGAPPN